MSKDRKYFASRLTVLSLILAMGTLFSFQPVGAASLNRYEDENKNQRDRDQNEQLRHEDDERLNRDQDQQRRDQQGEDQRWRKECDPDWDENCVCHRDDDESARQPREQQQNQDQEQDQNRQRDDERNCDQQQQQQPGDRDQQRNRGDEKQNRSQTQAAVQHQPEQDHTEYMDLSSFYFDSGWVAVQGGTTYMFNHKFGDLPSYVVIHQCGKLDKEGNCDGEAVIAGERGYQDGYTAINPIQVTSTKDSVKVVLGNFWAWGIWSPQTGWQCPNDEDNDCNTAYYRIQAYK